MGHAPPLPRHESTSVLIMSGSEFVVLVVAAGAPVDALRHVDADLVIAADSGLGPLRSADRSVDLVVGDLDSVDLADLDAARGAGTEVEEHSAAKDESDLELGLIAALERGATAIHVVVGAGGRLDHSAANLAVLASPRWADTDVTAVVGEHRVWVVRGRRVLPLESGDPVGLIPVGGDAVGVTTTGLVFPLDDERLDVFAARGIANQVATPPAVVTLRAGVLLAIGPAG